MINPGGEEKRRARIKRKEEQENLWEGGRMIGR